jgi:hypothetical protein
VLTEDQLRTLARASTLYATFGDETSGPWDERIRDLALESFGRPADDDIVTSAVRALDAEDRNLRVAALRVLRWHLGDPRAAGAVLQATRDPARRVRMVAIDLCGHMIDQAGVADRLREVIEDPSEVTKISGHALSALVSPNVRPLPESVQRSITDLLQADAYREQILLRLLQQQLQLDDSARALLRDIVRTGTKGEAVAATRALCGQRIVNIAHVPPEERKNVESGAEPVDLSWVKSRGYGGPTRTRPSLYWVPA